mmetsp:Transcript_21139/g.29609  ORF Transcript_21139/g.29609 Transcript_21139/m.29609 type:complete len:580 (+) Transcript_21139:76-1815(+)|eukprot:CAMPEP_0184858424 /NCGR_PEP_ID=MMETSP0580-20130426/3525_1 /TAXON_ID=1118495 /ORGANISM="Dactyliosolen fragilissimus" /LENGTH=579 /DNA_ID=CAMNT_0027354555 /DNA_START=26 /DNA_END=1765 /DNA_ORIENTATION=-
MIQSSSNSRQAYSSTPPAILDFLSEVANQIPKNSLHPFAQNASALQSFLRISTEALPKKSNIRKLVGEDFDFYLEFFTSKVNERLDENLNGFAEINVRSNDSGKNSRGSKDKVELSDVCFNDSSSESLSNKILARAGILPPQFLKKLKPCIQREHIEQIKIAKIVVETFILSCQSGIFNDAIHYIKILLDVLETEDMSYNGDLKGILDVLKSFINSLNLSMIHEDDTLLDCTAGLMIGQILGYYVVFVLENSQENIESSDGSGLGNRGVLRCSATNQSAVPRSLKDLSLILTVFFLSIQSKKSYIASVVAGLASKILNVRVSVNHQCNDNHTKAPSSYYHSAAYVIEYALLHSQIVTKSLLSKCNENKNGGKRLAVILKWAEDQSGKLNDQRSDICDNLSLKSAKCVAPNYEVFKVEETKVEAKQTSPRPVKEIKNEVENLREETEEFKSCTNVIENKELESSSTKKNYNTSNIRKEADMLKSVPEMCELTSIDEDIANSNTKTKKENSSKSGQGRLRRSTRIASSDTCSDSELSTHSNATDNSLLMDSSTIKQSKVSTPIRRSTRKRKNSINSQGSLV